MLFNGNRVPYVEVEYGFARNPSRFTYTLDSQRKGGARVRGKRLEPLEIPIPVVYSRRGSDASWDEIKEELASMLYREEEARIAFARGDGKYFSAQVVAIEFTEEHEYAAKGNIVIAGEDSARFGEEETIEIGEESQSHVIEGQLPTRWKSKTIFGGRASQFTLESDKGNIVLNYEFITGDILEIDYEERVITLNGNNLDVGLSLESVWFDLSAGHMEFRASHATELSYIARYY